MYEFKDEEIGSFVRGLVQAKEHINSYGPDLIIAPMLGAVPLIDCLNAVDCTFDNSKVYYVPASSSVDNLEAILPKTISNILQEKVNLETLLNKPFRVMSVDEVVGGSSAVRVFRGAHDGFRSYADKIASNLVKQARQGEFDCLSYFGVAVNKDTQNGDIPKVHRQISNKLYEKFDYKSIGFEHGRFKEKGISRQPTYLKLVETGEVIPVEVERILTMDNPDFCPVSYMPKEENRHRNYPTIKSDFVVTDAYLKLLSLLASRAGNSSDASPKNLARIREHQKYAPQEFQAKAGEPQAYISK